MLTIHENLLPKQCQDLLKFFQVFDRVYIFLTKRKMKASLNNIESIFKSILSSDQQECNAISGEIIVVEETHCDEGNNQKSITNQYDKRSIMLLCMVCPKQIHLMVGIDDEEEVIFPVYNGGSKNHSNHRRRVVLEGLSDYVYKQYYAKQTKEIRQEKKAFIQKLNHDKWSSEFNPNCIVLPDIVVNNLESQKQFNKTTSIKETELPVTQECLIGNNAKIIEYLKGLPFYHDQIMHVETIPFRDSNFGTIDEPSIPKSLQDRVTHILNVHHLYYHQAAAINSIRNGHHAIISTSTSSGKSMIYNIPVIEAIIQQRSTTALYLFPTKALAQDQLRSIRNFTGEDIQHSHLSSLPVWTVTCDGDTPHNERALYQKGMIKNNVRVFPNIVLTNPDMLHTTLLPDHKDWEVLLKSLKFVVIDEAHLYRGAFGSHVSGVMRRLVRLCNHYNASPQFICCSATIANPREHMEKLVPIYASSPNAIQRNLSVITADMDGSPRSERQFVIWNPSHQLPNHLSKKIFHKKDSNSMKITDFHEFIAMNEIEDIPYEIEGLSHSIPHQVHQHRDNAVDEFLKGCEDKPLNVGFPTMNNEKISSMDRQDDHVYYVGGWKGSSHKRKSMHSKENENNQLQSSQLISKQKLSNKKAKGSLVEENISNPTEYRVSSIYEAAQLFSALIKRNVRTLAFCKFRKLVELVLAYLLKDLQVSAPHLVDKVASYRGGYTKDERRIIESKLFSGELLGVTATCALELGVDIGSLDATLHLGFPGTISSLWQQAGRAGRNGGIRSSLSIFICFDSAIDQFYARNPTELFQASYEVATLNVDNTRILQSHVLCASYELPLNSTNAAVASDNSTISIGHDYELSVWGNKYNEILEHLCTTNQIVPYDIDGSHQSFKKYSSQNLDDLLQVKLKYWSRIKAKPATSIGLRMIDPISIKILDDSKDSMEIDSIGYSRAFFELYEGGIYMYRGKQYLVHKLDLISNCAHTQPTLVKYFTSSRNRTIINILKLIASGDDRDHEPQSAIQNQTDSNTLTRFGLVQIIAVVYGFNKHWLRSGEIFEKCLFSLPPLEYETSAFWVDISLEIQKCLEDEGHSVSSCMHTVNHVLVAMAPIFAQCDISDVACEHDLLETSQMHPFRLMLYDKRAGGLGACESLYNKRIEYLRGTLQILENCPCELGCPSCCLDMRCSYYNKNLDKEGSKKLLRHIIQREVTSDAMTCQFINNATGCTTPPLSPVNSNKNNEMMEKRIRSPNNKSPKLTSSVVQEITPRKKVRQIQLKRAKLRDYDRATRMALQMNWSDSIPNFTTETDMYGDKGMN